MISTVIGPGGSTVYDWKMVNTPKEPTDALAKPIVFGQRYGYSVSQSSRIEVVVGIAVKITPSGKISLAPESRRHFLYGEEYIPHVFGDEKPAKTVTVHPCHLFPVKD